MELETYNLLANESRIIVFIFVFEIWKQIAGKNPENELKYNILIVLQV